MSDTEDVGLKLTHDLVVILIMVLAMFVIGYLIGAVLPDDDRPQDDIDQVPPLEEVRNAKPSLAYVDVIELGHLGYIGTYKEIKVHTPHWCPELPEA